MEVTIILVRVTVIYYRILYNSKKMIICRFGDISNIMNERMKI